MRTILPPVRQMISGAVGALGRPTAVATAEAMRS